MDKIPISVIHYSGNDPRVTTGGVETFARTLRLMFADVEFMTPQMRDIGAVVRSGRPVICDNQYVLDWPDSYPVIGFQHGVGAVKVRVAPTPTRVKLAWDQRLAARRPNVLWVACAEWIARTFQARYDSGAKHVILHPVDIERFDGKLDNADSRLILHDARTTHKGKAEVAKLARAFPEWRFEPLACEPEEVPDRMRKARAFIHLSRYEGNSIVCNEAMAMDLPCLFTEVGLMQDRERPPDVYVVPPAQVFGRKADLLDAFRGFLHWMETAQPRPRAWSLANATRAVARRRWLAAMRDYELLAGRSLGLPETPEP